MFASVRVIVIPPASWKVMSSLPEDVPAAVKRKIAEEPATAATLYVESLFST